MRAIKVDGSREQQILIAMIVDEAVLGRVSLKWDKKDPLFSSSWANLVGDWCVGYHAKYKQAPGKRIESLFRAWADRGRRTREDPDVPMVEKFLASLSDQYTRRRKEVNASHLIDVAGEHFNRVRLERLVEAIQGHLDAGSIEKAELLLSVFHKVEMGIGAGVDVLQDEAVIKRVFDTPPEALVGYEGHLRKFFGRSLARDSLVAFMGPEKRGKTFWLIDVAWRAMRQRHKVAFFAVGDMSEEQMMERLICRAALRPLRSGKCEVPISIKEVDEEVVVERRVQTFEKPLDWRLAKKKLARQQQHLRSNDTYFKMSVHANDSINVMGIRDVLAGWERDGWSPEVIVIDYADILAPPAGVNDFRHQQNRTWQQLRALSQDLHCLVVTATQSDAKSYKGDIITRTNFSEDKRKMAHATGIIGLNQSSGEKEQGMMRLNWVVLRNAEFSERRCCYVAGCLAKASPAMISYW